MSSKWKSYSLARVRNDVPDRLLAEAFNRRFKRYLNRECLVAWLERAEGFLTAHPELGREMALQAPNLVQRAARERGLEEPELELRAWTVRGCMLRLSGDLRPAEKAFRRALTFQADLEHSPELASTWAAYALLKTLQGHHTKALELIDRALTLLRDTSDPRVGTCDRLSLSGALVVKGTVLGLSGAPIDEETTCFLEALKFATKRTPRSKSSAAQNLVVRSLKGLMEGEPVDADDLLRWCGSLHRQLANQGEPVSSPSRCRLRWLEAQVLAWKSGLSQRADAFFATARNSLLKHGAKQEVVLLNLDLGYWLSRDRNWRRLERLAQETLELARLSGYQDEAITALHQWSQALANRKGPTLPLAAFHTAYHLLRGVSRSALDLSPPAVQPLSRWNSKIGW